jgi:uncharacterized protein (TIGR00288 family)
MIANPRVMLVIDADNVSADVMEQAIDKVRAEHGAVHVRRAYCTAETAVKQLKLFKALSIRPIVNVSAGKNCTDIALAVDAIDLVLAERPDVVVIVSSDSDFAPLVMRLREKGCRVQGIGQEGKTGEASKLVYDAFVDLPPRKPQAARAPSKSEKAERAERAERSEKPEKAEKAAKSEKAEKTEKSEKPQEKAPAKLLARRSAAPRRKADTHNVPALPDDVQRILQAMPKLRDGEELPLNAVAEALREEGLLAKNGSSTKLFRKHPDYFVLAPERQPNRVRYRAPN